MKKGTIVEIISAIFILLFVYTAINKLLSLDTLKFVLKKYPLISNMSNLVAWGLPITELVVVALLFLPTTRRVGLYSSLILMSTFTIYLVYMMIFLPHMPCTCGGMLQTLSWPQHLIFNIFFVGLAIIGLRFMRISKNKAEIAEPIQAVFT